AYPVRSAKLWVLPGATCPHLGVARRGHDDAPGLLGLPADVWAEGPPGLAPAAAAERRKKFAPAMPGQGAASRNGDHNRKRIWSVQNRSRRCSDLLSAANSSQPIPPTWATEATCLW